MVYFFCQASPFSRNYSMVLSEGSTSHDYDYEDDDDDEEDDITDGIKNTLNVVENNDTIQG